MTALRSNLSVLVVDDHDVVHWGFRLMLARQDWVDRCLAARTEREGLEMAERAQPDVALVDLFLGDRSGVDLSRGIAEVSPQTNVLLMSGAGTISPAAARAAGASGFVPKNWSAERLAAAVREVGSGGTVFEAAEIGPERPISEREREVLELMRGGATNREIATALHLSPHTVKEYTSSLYRKLDVRNRAEAVATAERLGLTG